LALIGLFVRFKHRSSRKVLQLVTGLQLRGIHSKTTRVYIHNRVELVRKYEMSKYGKFEIPTLPFKLSVVVRSEKFAII